MIKKILLLCLTFLFIYSLEGFSQFEDSSYKIDSISSIVKSNPSVYQEIGLKFMNDLKSMNELDYLILYYGGAYTEDYQPYEENLVIDSIRGLLKRDEYQKALDNSLRVLETNPGLIYLYYLSGLASENLQKDTLAEEYYTRFYKILSIPIFSGNGLSRDSAFIVRSIKDEQLILEILGYEYLGMQHLVFDEDRSIPFDLLQVKNEEGETRTIYFNIYQPYKLGLSKMFSNKDATQKRKRKRKKK